ncbi:MAG TPA: Uma2 family endonuclease [Pirellulales bacterium]|nr:Uma2 family endonuclease [Pirellulales bacterium]
MSIAEQVRPEQRFLLRGISWSTYEALLRDLGDTHLHLTYDRGALEFMVPSHEHERFSRLLGRLVELLTFELRIPIRSAGSTTWKKAVQARGLEADECYYIRSEPLVRGQDEIDLEVDPPPDLAIEVEISHSAVDKLAMYAALRISEVWLFDGHALRVFELQPTGQHAERPVSPSFPFLPMDEMVRFLEGRNEADETTWLAGFQDWVRANFADRRRDASSHGPP